MRSELAPKHHYLATMRQRVRKCAIVIAVAALILPTPVHAKAMSLNACLALWRQLATTKHVALDTLVSQGAENARARLSKSQLSEIQTHIGMVERLKFRCRGFVPPPPGADAP